MKNALLDSTPTRRGICHLFGQLKSLAEALYVHAPTTCRYCMLQQGEEREHSILFLG